MPTLLEKEDPFKGFSDLVSTFEPVGDVYRTRRAVAGTTINDQSFLVDKPSSGFRIFCVGGSSAYGFPWNAEAAFGGMLGDVLVASHPDVHVEVVNASGVSYAIHRVNIIADELLAYEPDVFIVYSGHNEFVEPAFYDALKQRSGIRTRLEYALANSRVYAGMKSLISNSRDRKQSEARVYDALVRRDNSRFYSAAEKEAITAAFESRLDRLVSRAKASGVKVLLATVPCNLAEWPPERSTSGAGQSSVESEKSWHAIRVGKNRLNQGDARAALDELEEAVRLAPATAEAHYLLGRAFEDLGMWDRAREAYRTACDMDASPSRRVSAINDAIRKVGQKHGALLVDMDAVFEQNSANGLVGFELVEDYVHPTQKGHKLIAWHMWDAMEKAGWLGSPTAAERTLFDSVIAARDVQIATPTGGAWLFNQGVVLWKQKNHEAAIEKFRESLDVNPMYPGALQNIGTILIQLGRAEEALTVLERAVEIDPKVPGAHNALANAYVALGRADEAETHYNEALRLRPDSGMAHIDLANMLFGLERLEEAEAHYLKALQLLKDDGLIHKNLGVLMLSLGRPVDAATHAQAALSRATSMPDGAVVELGNLLNQTGQHAKALSLLERTVEIVPESADAHKYLADALRGVGRVEEALAQYQEASRLMPKSSSIHYTIGQVLESVGRFEETIDYYEEALRLTPDSAEVHHNLGVVLKQFKRFEEAEDHERAALRLEPDMSEAHNGLAIALIHQGKLAEAVTHFESALAIRPDYTNANRNLAKVKVLISERGVPGTQASQ